MPPSDTSSSYIERQSLLDEGGEKYFPGPRRIQTRLRFLLAALWFIILMQSLVILILAPKPKNQLQPTPAEDAVEYEVKSFSFGIGDDLSPFQKPPSPELDLMWRQLYGFGISRIPRDQAAKLPNKTVAIPGDPDGYYIAELEVFHQLHCLVTDLLKSISYYSRTSTEHEGNPKLDIHIGHYIDAIRQSLMFSADISTIVWQWDEAQKKYL
ncbi:hypothetical protein BDQ17DRAFT_1440339 [Cyathus striatus]|nr:hypothetical protein BDQ17DRAFT_1440339 [Cyathus striatus]